MVVLVQTLLRYISPTAGSPGSADVEATIKQFRKIHDEYSLGNSPEEG